MGLSKYLNKQEIVRVCQELNNKPEEVTDQKIDVSENFVLRVYYPKKLQTAWLEAEKVAQFNRVASNDIHKRPLSQAGLTQHKTHAWIQGGWLWRVFSQCFQTRCD